MPRYKHLRQRLAAETQRNDWADVLTDIFDGKPLLAIEAELQHYADSKIVGRPVFVQEACRNLQIHYEGPKP